MSVYFISRCIAGQVVYYSGCPTVKYFRECRRSALVQPPQTTKSIQKLCNIILEYKSNSAFLHKNELLFRRFSLLKKILFTSVRQCDQESLSSIVTPKRRVCFSHSDPLQQSQNLATLCAVFLSIAQLRPLPSEGLKSSLSTNYSVPIKLYLKK